MSKDMVPKRIFFTKGVGKHKERLTSFELALRDAGIAAQNLVRVSSIFPPQCKLIPRSQGLKYLDPGEVGSATIAQLLSHTAGLAAESRGPREMDVGREARDAQHRRQPRHPGRPAAQARQLRRAGTPAV